MEILVFIIRRYDPDYKDKICQVIHVINKKLPARKVSRSPMSIATSILIVVAIFACCAAIGYLFAAEMEQSIECGKELTRSKPSSAKKVISPPAGFGYRM